MVFIRYVAHFLVPRAWTGGPRELASFAPESLWDPQGKEVMPDALRAQSRQSLAVLEMQCPGPSHQTHRKQLDKEFSP